jgi:tetratricopeptide (TPR) repeat protein
VRSGLSALPSSAWEHRTKIFEIQLKAAAQNGGLGGIIDGYRTNPDRAPVSEVLRKTAMDLQEAGDKQSANKILEFVFTREIDNRNLTTSNMLGLTDIRLQKGDLEGAMALLRRMALVVGNPFEGQDPAAALLMRTEHPAQAAMFLQELVTAVPWNAGYRVRLAQAHIAAGENPDAASRDLVAIASTPDVPYESRLNAAQALTGDVPDLGSRELNLMVVGQVATMNDANQPFFFASRLKAAESLPAAARITLLRAALEDNPAGEAARIPLLKAASEVGDDHLAIAVMKPYLLGTYIESVIDRPSNPDNDEDESAQDGRVGETLSAMGGAFAKLSAHERAEINRDLGRAFVRTNALAQALPYWQKAYHLEPDPALKAQINKEVQQIRFVQRRREANRARRPQIHSELEQERIVRPHLPEPALSGAPMQLSPLKKGAGL